MKNVTNIYFLNFYSTKDKIVLLKIMSNQIRRPENGQNSVKWNLPQSTSHSFIVHVWLVFVHAPAPGDSLRVHKFKDAFFSVCPFDGSGASFFVLQQFEKELPEVGGGALTGFSLHWNAIRADLRLASFFLQLQKQKRRKITIYSFIKKCQQTRYINDNSIFKLFLNYENLA